MTVRYHHRKGTTVPDYICQRVGIETAASSCARIAGEGIDAAIGELLLATVTPLVLDVALAVQNELEGRATEADTLRRQRVERARHHAEAARRRYLAVDPDNRLVAANLEADWNDALRMLNAAQDNYQRQSARATPLSDPDKARVAGLASDFPALWSDPRTPQRERKRMVRLLIEDVTLSRHPEHFEANVRFKAGQATTIKVPVGLSAPDARRTPPHVITAIDQLLDDHTDAGIANTLNDRHVASGTGQAFTPGMIHHIRTSHGLAPRAHRLRARGLLPLPEAAAAMGVSTSTVKTWQAEGRLVGEPLNDKAEHYYHIPAVVPRKAVGRPPGTKNQPQTPSANNPGGAV